MSTDLYKKIIDTLANNGLIQKVRIVNTESEKYDYSLIEFHSTISTGSIQDYHLKGIIKAKDLKGGMSALDISTVFTNEKGTPIFVNTYEVKELLKYNKLFELGVGDSHTIQVMLDYITTRVNSGFTTLYLSGHIPMLPIYGERKDNMEKVTI